MWLRQGVNEEIKYEWHTEAFCADCYHPNNKTGLTKAGIDESQGAEWQINCVCVCVSGLLCGGEVIPLLSYLVVLLSLSTSCLLQSCSNTRHTYHVGRPFSHTHSLWSTHLHTHINALKEVVVVVRSTEHNVSVFVEEAWCKTSSSVSYFHGRIQQHLETLWDWQPKEQENR